MKVVVFDILNSIINNIVDSDIIDHITINRVMTGDDAVSYTYRVNVNRVYDMTINIIYDVVNNITDVRTCSAFIHSAPTILNIDSLCFVYIAETHGGYIDLVNSITGETIWTIHN